LLAVTYKGQLKWHTTESLRWIFVKQKRQRHQDQP